ncbi:MAG: transcriptional repressor [Lachnospiraceae bacterium]|nr:transcriptional repressor [Lachnospiraceae bacterium]
MNHMHASIPELPVFPEGTGLKKTKQRELIYSILAQADTPLNAQDIYQKLLMNPECTGSYAVSTVYRVLLAFEEKKLVTQTTMPGSEMAYYELNRGHRHYATCLSCHKRIPLEHCPFEHQILPDMKNSDFTITGHRLELYGYCKDCNISEKN